MRSSASSRHAAICTIFLCYAIGLRSVSGHQTHESDLMLQETTLSGLWRRAFVELPCFDNATIMDNGVLGLHRNEQFFQVRGSNLAATVIPSYKHLSELIEEYLMLTRQQMTALGRWPLEADQSIAAHVDTLFDFNGILPFMSKVVVPAGSKLAVFGDLHGAAQSFVRQLTSLQAQGYLSDDLTVAPAQRGRFYMVFCGDWVDRGSFGVETLALVVLLKVKNPESVWLSRGNHEDKPMNEMPGTGGFYEELVRKFPDEAQRSSGESGDEPFAAVWRLYEALPVATFIGVMPQGVQAAVEARLGHDKAPGSEEAAMHSRAQRTQHRHAAAHQRQRQLLSADGTVTPASMLEVDEAAEVPADGFDAAGAAAGNNMPVDAAAYACSSAADSAAAASSGSASASSGFAQSYIMAVHGGIELGVDPYPLLHGAPVDAADVAVFQLHAHDVGASSGDAAPDAAADGAAPDLAAVGLASAPASSTAAAAAAAAAVGPAFYFGRIHALRRRDWLDTLPPSARRRIPASVAQIMHNYGADREGEAAAFARQRAKRAAEAQQAGGDAAAAAVHSAHQPQAMDGSYPTTPMGTDPALGFVSGVQTQLLLSAVCALLCWCPGCISRCPSSSPLFFSIASSRFAFTLCPPLLSSAAVVRLHGGRAVHLCPLQPRPRHGPGPRPHLPVAAGKPHRRHRARAPAQRRALRGPHAAAGAGGARLLRQLAGRGAGDHVSVGRAYPMARLSLGRARAVHAARRRAVQLAARPLQAGGGAAVRQAGQRVAGRP